MAQPLNTRLTSMDASFLYFEKKEAPMHIGSVSIFEGEIPFDQFIANVSSKMHLLPRYQQKVAPDPFNLGHPTWEFDSDFDINHHIFRLEIDAPGSEAELIKLAGRIFSPMMDRTKPLWDIYLVYGLEGKRTAMIARVHHCMVDGVSGVDLLKIVLDISPDVQAAPAPPAAPPQPPRPDATRRFFDALLGGMQEGMDRWMEFQNGLLNLAQAMTTEQTRAAMPDLGKLLPSLAAPAPLLPFNRPCSGERKLVWSTFSFAEARAIRATLEGTVNDVVLTVLSGAVSRYVESHGQPVAGRSLRVMVPVSLRREEQRGALGNLVSMLPVEIPLDLTDPLARFRHIVSKTAAMKKARVAEGLNLFSALMGILPASVQALVGAMATTPLPAFNMVSTNVPGPQVPLYAMGKRMIAYYPYVPVGYAVGCGCAIMSYDQKLYFGLTSDLQAMPDVESLKAFLEASFVELRQAAGVDEIKPQVMKAAKGRKRG
ncbi:MAG TPA: wax ester/triacylglycerol synthase family O-acyltransferase [Blastocatellia bacterium]|nr:wax ester/triacylglycerol synthase family O-acyltransferase [Blastocatellia bacterium]